MFTLRLWNTQCSGHVYLLSIPSFGEVTQPEPKKSSPGPLMWVEFTPWPQHTHRHVSQVSLIRIFHSADHLPSNEHTNHSGTITLSPGFFLESQTRKNIWAFRGHLLSPCGQSRSENATREKTWKAKDLVISSEYLDPALSEAGSTFCLTSYKSQ